MGDKSAIEWTDASWNPVTGCTKVSQGCARCYAERLAPKVFAGQTVQVVNPRRPGQVSGAAEKSHTRPRKFTDVLTHPDRLEAPLRWRKPRRVFVNSMSDLFHEAIPFEFIASVFAVMSVTTRHTYQVLTKRPARMLEFFRWVDKGSTGIFPGDRISDHWPKHIPWKALGHGSGGGYDNCGPAYPFENVWFGVSCEDQATADERIPLLLQAPAAMRFLSLEPLLGEISFEGRWVPYKNPAIHENWLERIDWVIVGGESGPGARPMHPDWARSLRDQCQAVEVPFFFKQWGEWLPALQDGANLDGFQHVNASDAAVRLGKKKAGRLLDGREWNEFPRPAA